VPEVASETAPAATIGAPPVVPHPLGHAGDTLATPYLAMNILSERKPNGRSWSDGPDFELPDQSGEPVRLSELRGQKVVVYFYPKADTPGH
jgi:hypothetical protein